MFFGSYHKILVRLSKFFVGGIAPLETFCSNGIRMSGCTNKARVNADPFMAYFDINNTFDLIYCGDKFQQQKPDSRPITGMIFEMGSEASNVIIVGDRQNDIPAAHATGIGFVAINYGNECNHVNVLQLDVLADYVPELQTRLHETRSK